MRRVSTRARAKATDDVDTPPPKRPTRRGRRKKSESSSDQDSDSEEEVMPTPKSVKHQWKIEISLYFSCVELSFFTNVYLFRGDQLLHHQKKDLFPLLLEPAAHVDHLVGLKCPLKRLNLLRLQMWKLITMLTETQMVQMKLKQ